METMLLNIGPSHPAMHGTIQIKVELDGERVIKADVEIGYLHRGFEKTAENRSYMQVLPYTDRLNYVSPLLNNLAYAMAVEKLLGIDVPPRAKWLRMIFGEISRITDHLTCIAPIGMELGAFTVFLYMIKAREFLWDVLDATTGARLTTSYIRIGGVKADVPDNFEELLKKALVEVRKAVKDVHGLLSKNPIFLKRTRDIAVVTQAEALSYGFTGPVLRSTGYYYDVRKAFPYLYYNEVDFEVPLGERGDNYDRFMVRMQEIEQSVRIIEQAFKKIEKGPVKSEDEVVEAYEAIKASHRGKYLDKKLELNPNLEGMEKEIYDQIMAKVPQYIFPPKEDLYRTIEGMIRHFKLIMSGHGLRPPEGEVYVPVEGGNGELGFYIVSDGSDRPYRLHLRAPVFSIMSALGKMIEGHYVADVIPTFASINMIGGELDR